MNVKYFKDTDTALLEFSDALVDETREISENVDIDLDKDGNLVSMTIEHAALAATAVPATVSAAGGELIGPIARASVKNETTLALVSSR